MVFQVMPPLTGLGTKTALIFSTQQSPFNCKSTKNTTVTNTDIPDKRIFSRTEYPSYIWCPAWTPNLQIHGVICMYIYANEKIIGCVSVHDHTYTWTHFKIDHNRESHPTQMHNHTLTPSASSHALTDKHIKTRALPTGSSERWD